MSVLYPELEPYAEGTLRVGGDSTLHWEACGNPHRKPALVLHGGPGLPTVSCDRVVDLPAGIRYLRLNRSLGTDR